MCRAVTTRAHSSARRKLDAFPGQRRLTRESAFFEALATNAQCAAEQSRETRDRLSQVSHPVPRHGAPVREIAIALAERRAPDREREPPKPASPADPSRTARPALGANPLCAARALHRVEMSITNRYRTSLRSIRS